MLEVFERLEHYFGSVYTLVLASCWLAQFDLTVVITLYKLRICTEHTFVLCAQYVHCIMYTVIIQAKHNCSHFMSNSNIIPILLNNTKGMLTQH